MRIVKLNESKLNESKLRDFTQRDSYGWSCSSELPSGKKTQIFESDELVVLVFFEGVDGDAMGYHVEVTVYPDDEVDDSEIIFSKDFANEKSAIAGATKLISLYDKSGASSVKSAIKRSGYKQILGY